MLSQSQKNKSSGFTLVEMLVIAPIMLLVIGGLIALMVNLIGDVLITRERGVSAYQEQEALNRIEEDVRLSTKFMASHSRLRTPQGRDDNIAEFSAINNNDIILSQYATDKSPQDYSRKIIYYADRPNACDSPRVYQNTAFFVKVVYFIKESNGVNSLWRRVIAPNYNTNSTSDGDTVCGVPWQRPTCSVGYNNTTVCKGADELIVSDVSSMTVTYYTSQDYTNPTTDPEIAQSVKINLSLNRKVAGENITSSMTTRSVKLNSFVPEPTAPQGKAIVMISNKDDNVYNNPKKATFEWTVPSEATSFSYRTRIDSGSWSNWTSTEKNSTEVKVDSPYRLGGPTGGSINNRTIDIEVKPVNSIGDGETTSFSYTMPTWTKANLQNGWVCYDDYATGGYGCPRYTVTPNQMLIFTGLAKNGPTGNSTLFNLPAETRTDTWQLFLGWPLRIDTVSNGNVELKNVRTSWISISNIKLLLPSSGKTWTDLPLSNGWTNYASMDGAITPNPLAYTLDGLNRAHIRGLVRPGTNAYNEAISVIPESIKPREDLIIGIDGQNYGTPVKNFTSVAIRGASGHYIATRGNNGAWYDSVQLVYYPQSLPASSWKNLSLINSWTAFGGTYATPQYYRDADNIVSLKGLVKGGTAGTIIATLPEGYRPSKRMVMTVETHTSDAAGPQSGRVDIDTYGNITLVSAYYLSYVPLDGIMFLAEQ